MLLHVSVVQSLSWPANVPLCDYTPISSRVNGNWSTFQILSMVNSVTLNILVHVLIHMYTFVLCIYSGVEF